ncbi:MAG: PEP-CTERM sorting domain-containing protein [Smithella sp.]
MNKRKYLIILLFCITFLSVCTQASAILINFDDQGLTGSSLFGNPMQVITINNVEGSGIDVTFSGGVILTAATYFPANRSSVYGTTNMMNYTNPMTITFSQPVTNFFLDLYNGWPSDRTFTVSDNSGNSTTVTLPSNLASGQTLVSFAATGSIITMQDVTVGAGSWDFLIDNIHFNEPLPKVPLPSAVILFGPGLFGLAWIRRKMRK